MKLDEPYVLHILDCIAKIERFCKGKTRETFAQDELVRDATVRNVEIIGEAARNLSKEFREKHNKIQWGLIAGTHTAMRAWTTILFGTLWKQTCPS